MLQAWDRGEVHKRWKGKLKLKIQLGRYLYKWVVTIKDDKLVRKGDVCTVIN
jgi:hypothetical protein